MSETKFTPGPWKMLKDAQGPCMIMHPKKHGVAIASLTNSHLPANGFHDGDMAERNANAYLLFAAPELYEALEELLEDIKEAESWESVSFVDTERAQAAIKKARGE